MVDIPVNESTAETLVTITANGQELLGFTFLAFNADQIKAVYRPVSGAPEIELVEGVNFTVSGLNQPNGGQINLVGIATVVNDQVYIYRDTPIEREKDWQNEGDYKADLVNREQDEIYMIMQELDRNNGQSNGRIQELEEGLAQEIVDRTTEDARIEGESKDRDAALASLIGTVGGGNAPLFDSAVIVGLANINPVVNAIRTAGYSSIGDGGAALYSRSPVEPSHAGKIQSSDGAWWEIREPVVTPQMFGGANQLALVAAIAFGALFGTPVEVRGNDTYDVSSTITVPSGARLKQTGLALFRASPSMGNVHMFNIAPGADDVKIERLVCDGNKSARLGATGCNIAGGSTGTNIEIDACLAFDSPAHGFLLQGTNLKIRDCNALSNGDGGITLFSGSQVSISGNYSTLNGTHGIGILSVADHVTITGNVSTFNGQGPVVADNITGYNTANSTITVSGNVTEGGGNHGIHFGGSHITITGNVVKAPTNCGILVRAITPSDESNNVVVAGNTVTGANNRGIEVTLTNRASVVGNTVMSSGSFGIRLNGVNRGTVSGNTVEASGSGGVDLHGIQILGSTEISTSGNTSTRNAGHGLHVSNSTQVSVNGGNYNANAGWGVLEDGTGNLNTFFGFVAQNNTSGPVSLFGVNSKAGSIVSGATSTVTAAATITAPAWNDMLVLSGATAITTINGGWVGRLLVIRASGAHTLTHGAGIILAGGVNYVMSANDVITLLATSANTWVELSRSDK